MGKILVDGKVILSEANAEALSKIVIAVETGGQVYGKGRWDDYTPPHNIPTAKEVTVTLGAPQFYGNEAQTLITKIYAADPASFKQIDSKGLIQKMISAGRNWVREEWNPTSEEKKLLIKLISSNLGIKCQTELFAAQLESYVAICARTYTKAADAVAMYCEIAHLGGTSAAKRIFDRSQGFSVEAIMASLAKDQKDPKYKANGVGCSVYWSRHVACVKMIQEHIMVSGGKTMDALTRAKVLLRQPKGDVMTGYTPDGKSYFVAAGQWYREPKKGDVIYFYSTAKGRVGHVGIVESVDTASKIVHTVEGNTSSSEYAENGGCVARHQYSYASQGGTNRVNGFGRPDFSGAGVTADAFVAKAVSYLGYLEKKSNSQLDDFTANAGSNNYQKFQKEVGAGNGDQWCQYFVDAMAYETCAGISTTGGSSSGTTASKRSITLQTVKQGVSGASALLLQTILRILGYKGKDGNDLSLDGDAGTNTIFALKNFQKAANLTASGICTKATWSRLLSGLLTK